MIRRALAILMLTAVLVAAPQSADAATKTQCNQHPDNHKVCQTVRYRKLRHGVWVSRTRIYITNAATAGNPILTNVVVYLQNAQGGILKRVEVGSIWRGHPSRVVYLRRKVLTHEAIVTVIYTASGLDLVTTYIQTPVPGGSGRVAVPGF